MKFPVGKSFRSLRRPSSIGKDFDFSFRQLEGLHKRVLWSLCWLYPGNRLTFFFHPVTAGVVEYIITAKKFSVVISRNFFQKFLSMVTAVDYQVPVPSEGRG